MHMAHGAPADQPGVATGVRNACRAWHRRGPGSGACFVAPCSPCSSPLPPTYALAPSNLSPDAEAPLFESFCGTREPSDFSAAVIAGGTPPRAEVSQERCAVCVSRLQVRSGVAASATGSTGAGAAGAGATTPPASFARAGSTTIKPGTSSFRGPRTGRMQRGRYHPVPFE